MQYTLYLIDDILTGLAVLCLAWIAAWWAGRHRQDPLGEAPHRPNQLREDALALAVMAYLAAALVLSGVVHLAAGQTESVPARLVVGNGTHLVGIGVCLAIASTRFRGGLFRFFVGQGGGRLRLWGTVALQMTALSIGLCPLIGDATVSIIRDLVPDYPFNPHPTIEWLHDPTQPIGVVIALWAGAVVVAPIAEELFFRGLLQTFLVRVLPNRWIAIGLASLAFGAVHIQQPYAIPALAVLALFIGYAYERTGSLIPPIVIHAAFNMKTLIWDALDSGPI